MHQLHRVSSLYNDQKTYLNESTIARKYYRTISWNKSANKIEEINWSIYNTMNIWVKRRESVSSLSSMKNNNQSFQIIHQKISKWQFFSPFKYILWIALSWWWCIFHINCFQQIKIKKCHSISWPIWFINITSLENTFFSFYRIQNKLNDFLLTYAEIRCQYEENSTSSEIYPTLKIYSLPI